MLHVCMCGRSSVFLNTFNNVLFLFFFGDDLSIVPWCRGASTQDGTSYDRLADKAAGGLTKPFCLPVGWIGSDWLWVRGVEIFIFLINLYKVLLLSTLRKKVKNKKQWIKKWPTNVQKIHSPHRRRPWPISSRYVNYPDLMWPVPHSCSHPSDRVSVIVLIQQCSHSEHSVAKLQSLCFPH